MAADRPDFADAWVGSIPTDPAHVTLHTETPLGAGPLGGLAVLAPEVRAWTQEGRPGLHRETCRGNGEQQAAAAGPWWDEPDKVHWVDPESDLDCLLVRNHFGNWCGYVGLPPGHPWRERDPQGEDYNLADVHGGITYGPELCREDDRGPQYGICHVPFPGRPHDVAWIGFDAGHAFDYSPGLSIGMQPGIFPEETYKTVGYMALECVRLAGQVAAAGTLKVAAERA